jgi:hypothetical protein
LRARIGYSVVFPSFCCQFQRDFDATSGTLQLDFAPTYRQLLADFVAKDSHFGLRDELIEHPIEAPPIDLAGSGKTFHFDRPAVTVDPCDQFGIQSLLLK